MLPDLSQQHDPPLDCPVNMSWFSEWCHNPRFHWEDLDLATFLTAHRWSRCEVLDSFE
jgi:hypothetical protein